MNYPAFFLVILAIKNKDSQICLGIANSCETGESNARSKVSNLIMKLKNIKKAISRPRQESRQWT
jgi:hypothetical protein